MIIEQSPLIEGWKSAQKLSYKHFTKETVYANTLVYITADDSAKVMKMIV